MNINLINNNNGSVLIREGQLANTFRSRLKGLLGWKTLVSGQGMIIFPCNMIHTFGMKIAIDVLFLSENHEVLYIMVNMRPNRFSPRIKNSRYVVELPAGQTVAFNTQVGDRLTVINGPNII